MKSAEAAKEASRLLGSQAEMARLLRVADASTRAKAGSIAGYVRKRDGYLVVRINGRGYAGHRLAWLYVHGVWPEKIDHRNRDRSNNTMSNLREATTSQNGMNMGATCSNTSGFRGVTWKKAAGRWQAQSRLNGRNHYLGLFKSAAAASEAYEEFCRQHHGQFFVGAQEVAA